MTIKIKATPPPERYEMNGTEAEYADFLDMRKSLFEIKAWYFEAIKFILADKTTYRPDFMVILADDTVEFHEVKGFFRDDARVKINVAAATYPFPFVLIRKMPKKSGGGWQVDPIPAGKVL